MARNKTHPSRGDANTMMPDISAQRHLRADVYSTAVPDRFVCAPPGPHCSVSRLATTLITGARDVSSS